MSPFFLFVCVRTVLAAIVFFGFSPTVWGYNGGISGQTTAGCTCHGSANSATTVSIQGVSGSVSMSPGEQRSFTVVVAHGSLGHAGFNLGVRNSSNQNAGTLASGSGSQLESTELTHTTKKAMSGGETTWTFTWTAPTQTGTYTMRAAGNAVNGTGNASGDNYNFMSNVTINVQQPLTLDSPNGGETWCRSTTQMITWTPSGLTGNVRLEYSNNNGGSWSEIVVTPVTPSSYSWAIPANLPTGTQCLVRVTSTTVSSATDVSNATFSLQSNPSIVLQPANATVCLGAPAVFTVNTDNNAGYTFQWRKGGTPIAGATSPTYNIAAATMQDVGNYDVAVNGCQLVTSQSATLTVNSPPNLTAQSSDTSACAGRAVILYVTAAGAELQYQWRKNGTPISGAVARTFSIAALAASDVGAYDCVISGACQPPVTCTPIQVRLSPAPTISSQPKDTIICAGKELQLTVVASGDGLQYEWKRNATVIGNATGPTYVIASVNDLEVGTYEVAVTNSCGLRTSSTSFSITMRQVASIVAQPNDTTLQAGKTLRLRVNANGPNLKYQWSRGGVNLPKDTLALLTLVNIKLSEAGNYQCRISNSCGFADTRLAKVVVTDPPQAASLALSVEDIDFSCVKVGETKSQTISGFMSNIGGSALTITKIEITGSDAASFRFVSLPSSISLAPGESADVNIEFMSADLGEKNAKIVFVSNSSTTVPDVLLQGKGCLAALSITAANLSKININETLDTTLTVANSGELDVVVTGAEISGAPEISFGSNVWPRTFAAGASIPIQLLFQPTTEGTFNAEVVLNTSGGELKFAVQAVAQNPSSAEETTISAQRFSLSPNPVREVLILSVNLPSLALAQLKIVNTVGDVMFEREFNSSAAQTIHWNTEGMASGAYTAIIRSGSHISAIPFVIAQ